MRQRLNQPEQPGLWYRSSLPDDAWLTQYGFSTDVPPFRSRPRWPRESTLSMIKGRVDVQIATRLVRKRPHVVPADAVRYVMVGRLRSAGFVVFDQPTPANPDHMGVGVPASNGLWDNREWTAAEELAFMTAFDEAEEGDAR